MGKQIKICFQVWHWGGMKYTQFSLRVKTMLHCKSSLKVVLCRWHLTLSESTQQKKLSPIKTFPHTQASVSRSREGSWQRKCQRASSLGTGDPCALLGATVSQEMLYPQPEPPSNSRALNFVEILFRNSPYYHGHITACHSHKSSRATALLQGKAQAVPCRAAPLLLAGRLLQTWAKPRGWAEGTSWCLT